MESYVVIVLIFGFLLFIVLTMLYFVNRILQYKIRIDNSFFVVKEILGDREQIMGEMLEFLKMNLEHERSYQKKLVVARDLLVGVGNNKDGILVIKGGEKDFFSFVLLENTYKNLARNKDYLGLKDRIIENRDKLVYAMDSYDKGVISYNNYRKNKFINFLSKLCRFGEYSCYNE